uniref:rRNA-processing protein FYV7 n=1 Tax=Aegilops tauschii TaxID=37682 RepID=R7WG76_AEGTA
MAVALATTDVGKAKSHSLASCMVHDHPRRRNRIVVDVTDSSHEVSIIDLMSTDTVKVPDSDEVLLSVNIQSLGFVVSSPYRGGKKQKEFYRNAKVISKYKKSKKHQNQSNYPPQFPTLEEGGADTTDVPKPHDKRKKRTSQSLNVEYEKKRLEDEKAKKERDAMIQAKKEEREKSEAKRKELREKMFKRTRSGQPVMKYRIEHLLETALESSNK